MRTTALFICLALYTNIAAASPLAGDITVRAACNINMSPAVLLPQVINLPDAYAGNMSDQVVEQVKGWADYVMRLGSRARVSDRAFDTLKAELVKVAQADAMQWPRGWDQGSQRPPSVVYHTMETLFPAIVAYGQNRNRFSPAEQKAIEAWVGEIVTRLGKTSQVRNWTLDNKKYQYGAILAAYGYFTGHSGSLRRSQDIYRRAIRGLREDGSMPGDSGRGGNALHYTNLALANLVAIAEFNFDSGTDLYRFSHRGRSIHDAISFLAAATANPNLIAGYADTPGWEEGAFVGYSPTNQDRRWASGPAASWGYYYLRRFGKTESGQALRQVSPFLSRGASGVHQQSGGNARCFVG